MDSSKSRCFSLKIARKWRVGSNDQAGDHRLDKKSLRSSKKGEKSQSVLVATECLEAKPESVTPADHEAAAVAAEQREPEHAKSEDVPAVVNSMVEDGNECRVEEHVDKQPEPTEKVSDEASNPKPTVYTMYVPHVDDGLDDDEDKDLMGDPDVVPEPDGETEQSDSKFDAEYDQHLEQILEEWESMQEDGEFCEHMSDEEWESYCEEQRRKESEQEDDDEYHDRE